MDYVGLCGFLLTLDGDFGAYRLTGLLLVTIYLFVKMHESNITSLNLTSILPTLTWRSHSGMVLFIRQKVACCAVRNSSRLISINIHLHTHIKHIHLFRTVRRSI